jgi:DDE superfamily endonuclease
VLNQSHLYRHQEMFFEDATGCLLGDSAYRLTNRVIKPYSKAAVKEDFTGRLAQFNVHFSSARVKVEHAYGQMKGRFPILKVIPGVLGSIEGNCEAVDIIYAICVLHNFLLDLERDIHELSENEVNESERQLLDVYLQMVYGDSLVEEAFQLLIAEVWFRDAL